MNSPAPSAGKRVEPKRVVIIGGGIAGMTTALHLRDRAAEIPGGVDVSVLEAGARVGGNIRTDHRDGFTIERGPNGYLDNVPATAELVERLGLAGEVQKADERASKRFLFRDGRLHPLPMGPLAFLRSPVLSLPGRLRVLLEPFARRKPEGVDETIHDFVSRRIGTEAATVLVDAMVSGIFAGDTRALSLASAFPKMAAMEAEHGSLVRAMLARKRAAGAAKAPRGGPAGPGGTLTSFAGGLGVLVDALARELGGAIRCGAPVARIEPGGSTGPWRVTTAAGGTLEADAVVAAIPAPHAAPLLAPVDRALGETIAGIPTAGLVVVALGYDAEAVGGPPDGFGFLAPRGGGLRSLGCLWDSSIFPGRAPPGKVLLRVMIGGAHDPEAVELDDAALIAGARLELERAMGLSADPMLVRIHRYPLGIAQYVCGHQRRLARIHERLSALPGLWVAGSSFYGISMNACIEHAAAQAEEIAAFLAGRTGLPPAYGTAAGG